MRVLVSTTAGSGHFRPLLPVARACAAEGHGVVVAAPASFADEVEAAGFEHRPFADAPGEQLRGIFERLPTLSFEEANEVVVTEVFGRLDAQSARPGLLDIIADWRPDVVVREPCELGSLAAARSVGLPQAVVAIGVGSTTDHLAARLDAPLAELDARAGLPAGSCADAMRTAPTLTCVPAVLDGVRGDEAGAAPLLRFRDESLTATPGAAAPAPRVPGDPDHPLVYVSLGSVAAGVGGFAHLYADLLEAFADRPVRLLLTTGQGIDPADLAPVPAHVRVERWWPQAEVMPYAAAVVGHGGFGTTMTALAAGVPQVVMPLFAFDQRLHARSVTTVGAGVMVRGPEDVAAVPDAVAGLLADPACRRGAQSVARDMADLAPVCETVCLLEHLVAS